MVKYRMSILQKFLIVMGVALGCFLVGFYFVYDTGVKQALIEKGRTTAYQIRKFREWIAGYGKVWTKNSYFPNAGYLMAEDVEKGIIKTEKGNVIGTEENATFYAHNPALATRELSSISRREGYRIRVVSDRPMSPKDMPNKWELKAIKEFKKNKNLSEFYGFNNGKFYYAQPLYVTKACLSCHGDPNKDVSPEIKKALFDKYGQNALKAMNYKEGDLRGIITVVIDPNKTKIPGFFSYFSWPELATIFAGLLIIYFFVYRAIVKPIEVLTTTTEQIAKGRFQEADKLLEQFNIKELKGFTVKDETTRLAIAIDKLKSSIQLAIKKLGK